MARLPQQPPLRPRSNWRRPRGRYLLPGDVSELYVDAPPGLVIDQPPAMAGAGRVRGQQDIARVQDERLAVARREFERARKRYHVLGMRRGVPAERGASRSRFEVPCC